MRRLLPALALVSLLACDPGDPLVPEPQTGEVVAIVVDDGSGEGTAYLEEYLDVDPASYDCRSVWIQRRDEGGVWVIWRCEWAGG